jgi:hypothetical protein
MEEDDTIVLELTPREAAVIRRLSCFFAWDLGDFAQEMRAVFRALSEDEIRQAIDHIHVCVRYRDTNRLMAVNALMIDDVSSHRVIRIAE